MLICEGLFLLFGLYAIFTGKIRLFGQRTITGDRARLIGFLLLVPLIFGLGAGFIVGAMATNTAQLQRDIATLSVIEFVVLIGSFVISIFLALSTPPAPPSSTVYGGSSPPTGGAYVPLNTSAPYSAPPVAPASNVMTLSEAAAYLRVSEDELRGMIMEGKLRAVPFGNDYRISKEALDALF